MPHSETGPLIRQGWISPAVWFGRMTSLGMRAAVLLLPWGFLLGGLWHFKDDPGIGIFLVPVGTLLLLGVALYLAFFAPR